MVTHESWAVAALKAVAIAFHPWVFRAAVPVLVLALLSRPADRLAWWAAIQDDRRRHARVRAQAGDGPGTPSFDTPTAPRPGSAFRPATRLSAPLPYSCSCS